jgi:hypothetical protein
MNSKNGLLVACALLAGCASGQQWQKPGVSDEMVSADVRQCNLEAQAIPTSRTAQITSPAPIIAGASADREADRAVVQPQRMHDCMLRKGYELRPRG